METTKRFGEGYRKKVQGEKAEGICEVCGGELEIDRESGESHCPVCEDPEQ